MKQNPSRNKSILYSVVMIIIFILSTNCQISLLKYYEAQHALTHVIKSIKQNKIQEMKDQYQRKCTISNQCCLCNKNFKNASFLELHMKIHHDLSKQSPQHQMLIYIFDKRIKNQFRFQTCTKLLTLMDLNQFLPMNQLNQDKKILVSNHSTTKPSLTQSQIVDACTTIAYGTYHEKQWIFWIKCTLIFVFSIIFIVYYASVADEVNDLYFPKKQRRRRIQTEQ